MIVRKKREEKGMSRVKLAELLGVTDQYLYYIEKGERRPSIEVAKKLGKVLNVEDWREFYPDEVEGT